MTCRAFSSSSRSACSHARSVRVAVARPSRVASVQKLDTRSVAIDPALLWSTALAAPLLASQPALAKGGEYGILEGRTVALIHPIIMASLFGASLYAGYLGYQWRQTRTIGGDIKELKAQLPATDEDGNRPASPLDSEIAAMQLKQKDLVNGKFKDKHFNMGSILLASGVVIGIEGCLNTWSRTGKLFPGPHLFAGASIVALWAMAAALVPAMQKGDDNARTAHIGLNMLNVCLFVWQIPTGWEIVEKVFQFTSWP